MISESNHKLTCRPPAPAILISSSVSRGGFLLVQALVFLSCTPVVFAQTDSREAGRFLTQTFSPRDFAGDPYVWYAAQGNGGLMYFANLHGVLEFDGRTWRIIPIGNTVVRSVASDSTGRIYVGTRRDFGYLEPDEVGTLSFHSLRDRIPLQDREFGDVWQLLSTRSGIYYCTTTHIFRWSDRDGLHIWRGDFHKAFSVRDTVYVRDWERGLVRIAENGVAAVPDGEQFAENPVTAMLPYDDGRILLATYRGELILYDGTSFSPFVTEADDFLRTHPPSLYAFAALPGGRFALGTRDGGVVVIDRDGRMLHIADRSTGLRSNKVAYILVDHEGGLWLCHEDGISRWEAQSPISYFDETSGLTGNVEAILRHAGTLYAATSSGVFTLALPAQSGRTARFMPLDEYGNQCWDLASAGDRLLAGCTNGVYEVTDTRLVEVTRTESAVFSLVASNRDPNLVYLGMKDGLARLRLDNGAWRMDGRLADVRLEIRSLVENDDGTVWVGGANAMLHVDPARSSNPVLRRWGTEEKLAPGYVNVYRVGSEIVAAAENGLWNVDPVGELTPTSLGMDAQVRSVAALGEDAHGRVWMRTSAGLGVARVGEDGRWRPEWIPSAEGWSTFAIYPDPHGAVWLGGFDGIARYDPHASVSAARFAAIVRRVATIRSDSLLFGGTAGTTERTVVLSYADNAVRFTAGAATYDRLPHDASVPRFQYFLEGFDGGWSDWTDEIHKDYTNLPEGEYHLRVRARNAHGRLSPAAAVAFTILPPWYRTPWAYGIYVLVGFGLLYAAAGWRTARLERRNRELERQVAERSAALEKKTLELVSANARLSENERALEDRNRTLEVQARELEEMDAIKSRFFANISHEFRTPLTLILGPLEDAIRSSADSPPPLSRHVEPMYRSASRLLGLINQLLDLSRLESGRMTLRIRRADLATFLRRTVSVFESRAVRKGVVFEIDVTEETRLAYFDAEKLERVITNLLSNAFKFTRENDCVRVRLEVTDIGDPPLSTATITVEDSGPGIPPEEIGRIFDRFYTADPATSPIRVGSSDAPDRAEASNDPGRYDQGSGIGLALARELIELHGGTIDVESRLGSGTIFTVTVPVGKAHFDPGDIVEDDPSDGWRLARPASADLELPADHDVDGAGESETTATAASGGAGPKKRATILIVEDNADLRSYLRSHLEADYHVEEAVDGVDGFEKAKANYPSLIISDVMMPRMDGYALCEAVKSDDAISHIPFILLTARASDGDKVEGLALGADDYLFKPFNSDELLIRVENLIEIRRLLRRRFGKTVVAVEASEVEIVSADADFLDLASAVVEAHVDDSLFGVDWLADETNLSVRQLQRKLKDLTGLTPSGFIRTIRLQRAAQILEAGGGNVTEVAAAVGFNDPKHFSKLFRQVFGIPPSQYESEKA